MRLYVNGALEDVAQGFLTGMGGNAEDVVLGASARRRKDGADNL